MLYSVAKPAGEGDLLPRSDLPATEKGGAVRLRSAPDQRKNIVVKRLRQVDATDFGTEGYACRDDVDGHGVTSCWRETLGSLRR
jgi:hypothetical protein